MQFNPALLIELANQILALQSFQFDSFAVAKTTIVIKAKPSIEYTFDRLSLCVYSHNLDEESYSYLGKMLTDKFEASQNREACKCRKEYGILFHFMAVCPEYSNMKVAKKERPDFELSGERNIGIEITEFTTPRDSIMQTIAKQNFGQEKSAAEIKRDATIEHGQKATTYGYYDLGNRAVIEIGMFNVGEKKQIFAEEVIKKYSLYKEMLKSFDEFMILCNAQHTICVTCRKDSDDIVEVVRQTHPVMQGFTLCILREDNDCQLAVDKYLFR